MRTLLTLALLLGLSSGVWAEEETDERPQAPLHERVNKAIDAGVAWLEAAQLEDGSWGPCMGSGTTYDGQQTEPKCYDTGPTSFAMFTLLTCGVPRRDKVIRDGRKWLHEMETTEHQYTSYESSSTILMLTAMYDTGEVLRPSSRPESKARGSPFRTRDWDWLDKRVKHLAEEGGCMRSGGGCGYWPGGVYYDTSATQFALLALRAAARAGYPVEKVSESVWRDALTGTNALQLPSGTFRYSRTEDASAGMTAAGLANLLICKERLGVLELEIPGWVDGAVDKAFEALGQAYAPDANRGPDGEDVGYYHFCYLYAIERVGSLSGKQLMGTQLWYATGAKYLLDRQHGDGSWFDLTCMGPGDVLGTCFALLFLKKATPPATVTGGG